MKLQKDPSPQRRVIRSLARPGLAYNFGVACVVQCQSCSDHRAGAVSSPHHSLLFRLLKDHFE